MSKDIIFMQPPYSNFLWYYEKSINFGSFLMNRIPITFQNVEVYYFYAAVIFNFRRYYEKYLTFGSNFMSRIQKTFQNDKVYYLYAAAIFLFSKILWKILYRSKRHYEQNSVHSPEGRSVLLLRSRHLLIF